MPPHMGKYLDCHLKRCLSKEERDALFKEHPKPDLASCNPPKVDRYMADFLGKRMPREHVKLQSATLAIVHPLASAWSHLMDAGLEADPGMVVPGTEVLAMLQCTLCLVGNAAELISQTRRSKILELFDPSWSKFATEISLSGSDSLFGDDFQSTLKDRVEKDVSLSKAVSITKNSKREKEPSRSDRPRHNRFFRGGPPAKYGGRQGRSFFPYNPHPPQTREKEPVRGKFTSRRQPPRHQYHEPKLPSDQEHKIPQKRF